MTVFGKLLVAVLVSFFLMIGALGSGHATFLIILALLVWVLFVRSISSNASARQREQRKLFDEFMKFKNTRYKN